MLSYLKNRKLLTAAGIYLLLAVILKKVFAVNIFIPCLWTTCFNKSCLGCGTTTAFLELLSLNFGKAYAANPLIYLIVAIGMFVVINDYQHFLKKR